MATRPRSGTPGFRAPQLATLVDKAPPGDDWVHEIKYDGYRLVLSIGDGRARAFTRNGLDWSDKFAAIVAAAGKLKVKSALIDGEAVVMDENGRSRFQLLQNSLKSQSSAIILFAFDILELDGEDLTGLPLTARKKRLAQVIGKRKTGAIRYSEHVVGHGEAAFKAACGEGLEGIISKRANAKYVSARNETWLKVKCIKRQEFVIVGWTRSDKNRGFRSLILAVNDRGALRYAGKVGTGFDMAEIERLLVRMRPLEWERPTVEAPRAEVKGAHWLAPKLIAEIAFTEMTSDGTLRHPSYQGLREDKGAAEVVVERAKPVRSVSKKASSKKRKPS